MSSPERYIDMRVFVLDVKTDVVFDITRVWVYGDVGRIYELIPDSGQPKRSTGDIFTIKMPPSYAQIGGYYA